MTTEFLDVPRRERLAVRSVLVLYGALVAQDQRIIHLGPRMLPSYLAHALALFCALELIDRVKVSWQRAILRCAIIGVGSLIGAAMGHTNPNARGAIFLAVAALFEQGWDFGLRLSPRWHAAALCLFTGTANSLARYRYGTTIALDQFVLTGYGLVAFIVARQRRRENDRTNQNHQEQLDFLTGYSFALGQQKSDLAFHDLKTIAHLMTTSGSRDAREILEGQDELGVMTHVPQLGIVPLGEVVGPEVEPEGAWAFPITPHRKERILSQLSKHSAVTRFQVINYAHLLTDPRMQMQIAVNERVHDVGPPVDKQSFRLEPDVFVFLFAAFWFATEVFVPLPPWLRYVQLAGIMLCLNCAFETQRKGIDNAPKARTAFMTLAVLEFSWIGLRLIHSIQAPAFPPSVAVSALMVGIARCSIHANGWRDRAMFVGSAVMAGGLMASSEWAWWAAIGQVEFGTAVSTALITYLISRGTRHQRHEHAHMHEAHLTAASETARQRGQDHQTEKWREILNRLRSATSELESSLADAMRVRLNKAESLA